MHVMYVGVHHIHSEETGRASYKVLGHHSRQGHHRQPDQPHLLYGITCSHITISPTTMDCMYVGNLIGDYNLKGSQPDAVQHHQLRLSCSRYLPVDDTMIPTGEIAPIQAGSVLDFYSTAKGLKTALRYEDPGKTIGTVVVT